MGTFADDHDDHDHHDHEHEHLEPSPEIDAMVEELRQRAEKLGLYMQDAMVATRDDELAARASQSNMSIRDAIEGGAEFLVMAAFMIGDQAFSTRVLNPEQYEINKEAQVILPDAATELKRRLEEGGPMFGGDAPLDEDDV